MIRFTSFDRDFRTKQGVLAALHKERERADKKEYALMAADRAFAACQQVSAKSAFECLQEVKNSAGGWIKGPAFALETLKVFEAEETLDSFVLTPLIVRAKDASEGPPVPGEVSVLLSEEQLSVSKERLDGLIAGLRRVGSCDGILAYSSLGTVVVEVGSKQRPLTLCLEDDETFWSFRATATTTDFDRYSSGSMSTAPSDAELAGVIAAFSATQACKPIKTLLLSRIKSLSDAAFTTANLSLR